MLKSLVFSCLLVSAFGFSAHAQDDEGGTGMFLEPGLTYQVTESNLNYPSSLVNSNATTRGWGVVLRGGAHVWERIFIAADARYALLRFQDNANNISTNATSWDIAPVVGIQMADYGVRLYGGYVLAGFLDPNSANGLNYKFENPNGWRVGAGLKLKAFSVNIEWQRLHYGKTTIESLGRINAGADTGVMKLNEDGLVASVTFPIEFK